MLTIVLIFFCNSLITHTHTPHKDQNFNKMKVTIL